ncbi:MAG: CheR family methyltransferase [Ignavibacteriales bacterium]
MSESLVNNLMVSLSQSEFNKLSTFIYNQCGIKMPPTKKIMLEARLRKRLKDLSLKTFPEYCDFLFSKQGMEEELVHMIDVVTTNKTDFFREPHQFTFLLENVLPELVDKYGVGVRRKFRTWSAGCSSGEEPYTLAMVLSEFGEQFEQFDYSILASDISTLVLEKAMLGIYDMQKVEPVPLHLKKKYLLKSKDPKQQVVRIVPELRKKLELRRINFMDDDLGITERQDVIFCRNVIIYFDKPTQEKLIKKLISFLLPEGYLFLGHSETLFSMDLNLEQVAPSTYRKIK